MGTRVDPPFVALRPLHDRAEDSALFLDFDGTLSPIVSRPEAARPVPGTSEVLARLARGIALVVVVSGRPATFLKEVFSSVEGVRLVGLYGLEEVRSGGVVTVEEAAAPWRPVVDAVTAQATAAAPFGLKVEPKGLTVTLHWRGHPEAEDWAHEFAQREAASGLVVQHGRMALELRPPVEADKGTVVRRLGSGHRVVAYFGDDLGDLPAFDALDELAARGATVIKVAVVDPESPAEVRAAADVQVEGPAGALEVLRELSRGW